MDANLSSNPNYWQNQLNEWSRTKGLQDYINSGLQDSTIGKSGYFDEATAQGQALRQQALARAAQVIGQAPTSGLNPSFGGEELNKARILQNRQGAANIQSAVQGAQGNAQSTLDWINQMMGSQSQMLNANQQNWQNYRQAMYNDAVNQAASNNAASSALFGSAGGILGGALGGLGGTGNGSSTGGSKSGKSSNFAGAGSGALQGAEMGSSAGTYGALAGALLGGTAGYFAS
jgi:hypothetical protein